VEGLLKPENKDKLVGLLTYHVVAGKVLSKTAVTLDKATAGNKQDIALAVKGEALTLNGSAKVVKADIECSNGVIHVIDAVILPPAKQTAPAAWAGRIPSRASVSFRAAGARSPGLSSGPLGLRAARSSSTG